MTDGRHLEKTQIGHPNPKKCSKSQFLKHPRWRMAAILKIVKWQYLRNRLADFDEILHDGTY